MAKKPSAQPQGDAAPAPAANERCCQNCNHHTSGIAVTLPSGTNWCWQDCTKGWGKPSPIGVLKNVCGLHIPKKDIQK